MPDESTEERIGRNDALFRSANERIRETAAEYEITQQVPFFCECADVTCRAIVQLSLEEYEAVRAKPRQFFNAPGHEVNARGAADVLERNDRYVTLEKLNRAGEVAEELDERDPV